MAVSSVQPLSTVSDSSPNLSSQRLDLQAKVNKMDGATSSSQRLKSNMAVRPADWIKSTDSVGASAGMRDSISDTDTASASLFKM